MLSLSHCIGLCLRYYLLVSLLAVNDVLHLRSILPNEVLVVLINQTLKWHRVVHNHHLMSLPVDFAVKEGLELLLVYSRVD